jgi:hypothetical protein
MALVVMTGPLSGHALAYPKGANPHSQFLGGPYELLVKRGMQGAEMLFPVKVDNESVPGKLDTVFPIMGSSAKIKLEQFLPELVWEQYTERSEEGGSVVKLRAVGPNLDQEVWLCAEDTEKQSISSMIGGIGVKKVPGADDLMKTAAQLTDPNAIGILSVWHKDPNIPTVYVVSGSSEIQIEDSPYKFKVLEYMPHYSVDTETKAIQNASPEPKNPAIRVKFTDGDTPVEQWIFSRFKSHPHMPNKIPLRMEFTDFDLGTQPGNYTVLVSPQGQSQILFRRDGSKQAQKISFQTPYPLAQEGYNFIIDEIFSDVVLKKRWKNNRNQLLNPALIASVDRDGTKEQVVLELNKPQHLRSETETMVMVFRRKVEPVEHLE